MLEFKPIAYLDLHKTGSTQIQSYFEKYVDNSPVYFKKHDKPSARYKPHLIYCISLRDPVEQYISLFRYGMSGRGGVFQRLSRKGYSYLYSDSEVAFYNWYNFICDSSKVKVLDGQYAKVRHLHDVLGYISFRTLCFLINNAVERLQQCRTRQDIESLVDNESIVSCYLKNESLEEDFIELLKIGTSPIISSPLNLRMSISEIEKDISNQPRLNTSIDNIQFDNVRNDSVFKQSIMDREWLYKRFGY